MVTCAIDSFRSSSADPLEYGKTAGNADGWFGAHGGQILKIGFKRSLRHIVAALAQLRD
jgi:hypothetical protein